MNRQLAKRILAFIAIRMAIRYVLVAVQQSRGATRLTRHDPYR